MRLFIQNKPGILILSLEGRAESDRCLAAGSAAVRQIEERVRRLRPKTLLVDFRDLVQIDGASFCTILSRLRDLASRVRVQLVGPGPAVRRWITRLEHPAPVALFPSLRAARQTFLTSFADDPSAWGLFFRQFGVVPADLRKVELRSRPREEFAVDLDEEAAYLESEGETVWSRPPPQIVEFRQMCRSPPAERRRSGGKIPSPAALAESGCRAIGAG
ncbi:MAG: hypothetical protein JXA90_16770 [Planctomycetes bacterium]|nr:hypothetical protein [Planctomycetota bacterium]